MDNLIIIIFACVAIPLVWSLAVLDNKARLMMLYIIIGGFMCVFISGINSMLAGSVNETMYYITTNITPMTEEIIKALPVLFFAFVFSDDRVTLLSLSVSVGIGFAIIENAFIFTQAGMSYSLPWALGRVFGASLVHALCTTAIGYGISFIRKKKKLFYTGTFALLLVAIVYHSIFNAVIQSSFSQFGLLLPIVSYIPFIIMIYKKKKSARQGKAA